MPQENENIVIVIDPGHGGENLGGQYGEFNEKEMNMIVANAMAEELQKYEGITVFLTRTEDIDLSLKERADFAHEVNADFFFCLHFNKSVHQDLYGAEVWISAFGEPYAKGMEFSRIQIEEMENLGLFSRGIKTKLNDRGTDWYGIPRHCTEYGIPSALIEHCHMDHINDSVFCDSREELVTFGKADATSVAKYFGLRSEELQVDYSDYFYEKVTVPMEAVKPDSTPPHLSFIEEVSEDYETGEVTIQISGSDSESSLLYFSISLNGGQSYSERKPWPESDSFQYTFQVPSGMTPYIKVRVYNLFDLYSESNMLVYDAFFYGEESELNQTDSPLSIEDDLEEPFIQPVVGTPEHPWKPHISIDSEKEDSNLFLSFLLLSLLAMGVVFFSAFLLKGRTFFSKKKKKQKNNKEL